MCVCVREFVCVCVCLRGATQHNKQLAVIFSSQQGNNKQNKARNGATTHMSHDPLSPRPPCTSLPPCMLHFSIPELQRCQPTQLWLMLMLLLLLLLLAFKQKIIQTKLPAVPGHAHTHKHTGTHTGTHTPPHSLGQLHLSLCVAQLCVCLLD